MAVFAYKAAGLGAPRVSGTVVADTPRQARDQLRARGLAVHEIAPLRTGESANRWRLWGGRPRTARVASFIRELSTLLGVGIPLLEALDTLTRGARQGHLGRGGFHASLLLLRDRVSEGVSLADAMRRQPRLFDELVVSITEVGENAGTLEAALEQLADYKERSAEFRNRVGGALLYPLIVLITGLGVGVFLMTFVVPQLLSVLLESGRELPLVTRVVKGVSDAILYHGWLILGGVIAAAVAVGAVLGTPRGRLAWHRLQLRTPLVGELVRKQAVVRVALVVATLMRSGVTFLRALEIAQRSTQNLVLRDALVRCEAAVGAGRDIGAALEATGAFPATVVQVFAVGQHSGRLEEMLERLARDYDRQVATATGRLTAVLEPILILVLAAVVGCIAFATILPILEAGNAL